MSLLIQRNGLIHWQFFTRTLCYCLKGRNDSKVTVQACDFVNAYNIISCMLASQSRTQFNKLLLFWKHSSSRKISLCVGWCMTASLVLQEVVWSSMSGFVLIVCKYIHIRSVRQLMLFSSHKETSSNVIFVFLKSHPGHSCLIDK